MWDSRGDGSSRPRGAVLYLPNVPLMVQNLISLEDQPETNANFKTKGYILDDQDLPTFLYEIYGSNVEDKIRIIDHKYLERNINIKNPAAGQKIRIGMSSEIKEMGDNLYALDGKSYYIKAVGASIEGSGFNKVLTLPATEKVQYSILW
jgi:hypothetical protein